jgi:hypothetical protein
MKTEINYNRFAFKQSIIPVGQTNLFNKPYKIAAKGLIGHPLNSETLIQYNNKTIVYSFNKKNNLYPLISKTEYLLKSLFLSMCSLISKPVYLLKHDKIIIRLFVFISPRMEKYLDTSIVGQKGILQGASPSIFTIKGRNTGNLRKIAIKRLKSFLKFKSFRPKTIEILKSQIEWSSNFIHIFKQLVSNIRNARINNSEKKLFINNFSKVALGTLKHPDFELGEPTLYKNSSKMYPYISLVSNFKNRLENLSIIFSKIFKKRVEFEIIKAQLPFQDSNILAQILGYNANNYNFRRMIKILTPRAVIKNPSRFISNNGLLDQYQVKNITPGKNVSNNTWRFASQGLEFKDKDLNIFFSQPSSYLPPIFYTKFYYYLINPILALSYKSLTQNWKDQASPAKFHLESIIGQANKTQPLKDNLTLDLLEDKIVKNKVKYNINLAFSEQSEAPLKNDYSSYLSGMNIKLAGRLMTQSIRPRFTVQSKQEGSLARVKVHYIEKSRYTGKNKRGAFSFTVTISHVLNK